MFQPIGTPDFEITIDLDLKNNKEEGKKSKDPEGFGIWYLHYKPNFPNDFGDILGYTVCSIYLSIIIECREWSRSVCFQVKKFY